MEYIEGMSCSGSGDNYEFDETWRMFPYLRLQVTGLDPYARYFIMLELSTASESRYKFSGNQWVPVGAAEPQLPPAARLYIHPDSPAMGGHWTGQHVLFNKVKLTNNTLDRTGNIVLNSMHKYQPKVHVVMASDVLAVHWSPRATFHFPETQFTAVTAYQNELVTKLKIDHNPFAKGFRDNGMSRCKKRKTIEPDEPLKVKKEEALEVYHSTSTSDDSGVSSLGSPTPPVTTPPITSFSDSYPSYVPTRLTFPDIPYFQPPLWSYQYFLPPPPPLYPAPYFNPYLLPPTPYQPPGESFLIDLSVKKSDPDQ